jgi:hypothetical protein
MHSSTELVCSDKQSEAVRAVGPASLVFRVRHAAAAPFLVSPMSPDLCRHRLDVTGGNDQVNMNSAPRASPTQLIQPLSLSVARLASLPTVTALAVKDTVTRHRSVDELRQAIVSYVC